jgi:hypothetical protein
MKSRGSDDIPKRLIPYRDRLKLKHAKLLDGNGKLMVTRSGAEGEEPEQPMPNMNGESSD